MICNDNVYLSLYKRVYRYKTTNVSLVHESMYRVIRDDV